MNKDRPVMFKSFTGDFKVSKDSRTVSGYLAAFGNIDGDGDMLIKGCFAKSISDRGPASSTARKIAYLYHHDMSRPLGRFTELKEDDKGLYFEAELDNIQLANETLEQYISGTLNQHSIGFRYVWDKCEADQIGGQMVLICRELQLFEGSVVTLGANENTPFLGLKRENFEETNQQLLTEFETLILGLDAIKQYQIRSIFSKMIALSEAKPETLRPEPGLDFEKLIKILNK